MFDQAEPSSSTFDPAGAPPADAFANSGAAPDLHIAFTDSTSKVLLVTDETTDQVVTSGNTVNFPILTYTSAQPV